MENVSQEEFMELSKYTSAKIAELEIMRLGGEIVQSEICRERCVLKYNGYEVGDGLKYLYKGNLYYQGIEYLVQAIKMLKGYDESKI